MSVNKKFGECELLDGGFGRRILYSPISLYENVPNSVEDRDRADSVARIFAKVFGGRPIWYELYGESYAVEMPQGATDEQIQEFVDGLK